MRRAPLLLVVAALLSFSPAAHADLTSWLSLGGGYSLSYDGRTSVTEGAGAFSGAIGVGTTPIAPVVVGGVARVTTRFGLGTDLGIFARVTTGGFSRGDWGLGLDVGPSGRFWTSGDFGRYPLQAVLLLGAPWGLQVSVGADLYGLDGQSPTTRGGFAILELDLLRFSLMRQGSTESFWPNPSPAGGHMNAR